MDRLCLPGRGVGRFDRHQPPPFPDTDLVALTIKVIVSMLTMSDTVAAAPPCDPFQILFGKLAGVDRLCRQDDGLTIFASRSWRVSAGVGSASATFILRAYRLLAAGGDEVCLSSAFSMPLRISAPQSLSDL
jgi:hypothetical protein